MSELDLLRTLEALGRPRVLIIGDLILDRYISGDVRRISPEAPIPILTAREREDRLGGAANVAANLRSLEAEVEMLGVVGEDGLGRRLVELLGEIGVETRGIVRDGERPTIEKTRLVSGVQQMLRVDWERSSPISPAVESALLAGLAQRVARAQAVILSDYAKGLLTPRVIESAIEAARARGIPVLVDPKGTDYARYRRATLVTPNRREAEEAVGRPLGDLSELPAFAKQILETAELDAAVITLGADGIFHYEQGGAQGRVPTMARAVFDVTGAGDTVIATMALALADKQPLAIAVRLANQAAGIVVGKRGAASTTRAELRAVLGEERGGRGKVLARTDLPGLVAEWRAAGKRIALTNGCFDILHPGHVEYLRFARSKGDVLLVGVNEDASVRRLKGPTRPICPLEDRMQVLAALEMVDAVVPFGEDTPARLVEEVSPHALIKGEDWADKGVVGREWVERHGGEVHLAPLLAGRSTSSIVERVRLALAREGQSEPASRTPPSC